MADHDGVVEQSLRIRARPETVWRYWTDPGRICAWWGVSAELDPVAGGRCWVDLGGGAVMEGVYVEVMPYERLVFTFGWAHADGAPEVPPGSSTVEVVLVADGEDTLLTLRHTGLPRQAVSQHHDGWAYFLPLLAREATPEQARP